MTGVSGIRAYALEDDCLLPCEASRHTKAVGRKKRKSLFGGRADPRRRILAREADGEKVSCSRAARMEADHGCTKQHWVQH